MHCFICRPSDSTVPEDVGTEPRTLATSALAVRRSNLSLNFIDKKFIYKKECTQLEFVLFYTNSLANNFSWVHFFQLFPRRKILRILDTRMQKKNKQILGVNEYFLKLVECKFARNGWTNWKTGESHQVVKLLYIRWWPFRASKKIPRPRIEPRTFRSSV